LGQFEIGGVGGNARAAAIGDQRRFGERIEPEMAFGRLCRGFGCTAIREDAETAAGAANAPHDENQRHGAKRDDQHGAGGTDRLAPRDGHAGGAASDDQRCPEGQLNPVESLARASSGCVRLVVGLFNKVSHGRSSAG
jgi:hypothetical protein